MLRMLDHDASDALVRPVTLCAGLKFTALLTVVGYLVSTNPPLPPVNATGICRRPCNTSRTPALGGIKTEPAAAATDVRLRDRKPA